ncbi:DUF393 domain-containing protein [Shewanella maritima]|uniref:DUF393 domain-containing protein n=1 Tax=Shewanella maritima TaxID=2520507 RepID=A0A411PK18_9GAMM|nr:DUF393 domain-containing protein [Shewanella maritima]QBF83750.1 DUF393 domain-containing protein [Shewanella maritima]
MQLTIFYDSACPLCSKEMAQLKSYDRFNSIVLQDLNAEDINERFPTLDTDYANTILHGWLHSGRSSDIMEDSGEMLLGLDVTAKAWQMVGKHPWIQLLRLPGIKCVADKAYLKFASNRYRISYLLTGQKRCDGDSCSL